MLPMQNGARNAADRRRSTIAILGMGVGGNMEKTLEKELEERERQKLESADRFKKLRHRGRHIVHGKIMLLAIVILCMLDCALVMGGLILELNVMKAMSVELKELKELQSKAHNCTDAGSHDPVAHTNNTPASDTHDTDDHGSDHDGEHEHSVETKIAHSFHYASIAILAILLLETIVKMICFGKHFFDNKFEVFDAIIVTASFVVDLVFLEGTTGNEIIDTAQVLSFMLPWRVVRVVNSMIVSLLSHEHIKLLMMFKSKQYVQKQVGDLSEDLETVRQQMMGIKKLAIDEGVPDWKISKVIGDIFMKTQTPKKNALNTMVSMAMGAAANQNQNMVKQRNLELMEKLAQKQYDDVMDEVDEETASQASGPNKRSHPFINTVGKEVSVIVDMNDVEGISGVTADEKDVDDSSSSGVGSSTEHNSVTEQDRNDRDDGQLKYDERCLGNEAGDDEPESTIRNDEIGESFNTCKMDENPMHFNKTAPSNQLGSTASSITGAGRQSGVDVSTSNINSDLKYDIDLNPNHDLDLKHNRNHLDKDMTMKPNHDGDLNPRIQNQDAELHPTPNTHDLGFNPNAFQVENYRATHEADQPYSSNTSLCDNSGYHTATEEYDNAGCDSNLGHPQATQHIGNHS